MSRAEHDDLLRAFVTEAFGRAEAAAALERWYPAGTPGAVFEACFRGTTATAGRVEYFASKANPALRIIGKQRVWYRSDIDALVEQLEIFGATTMTAQRAEALAMPFAALVRQPGFDRIVWFRELGHVDGVPFATRMPVLFQQANALDEMLAGDLRQFHGGADAARTTFMMERDGALFYLLMGSVKHEDLAPDLQNISAKLNDFLASDEAGRELPDRIRSQVQDRYKVAMKDRKKWIESRKRS